MISLLKKFIFIIFPLSLILFTPLYNAFSYSNTKHDDYYTSWSKEEVVNSQHFLKADEARRKAIAISNSWESGSMSDPKQLEKSEEMRSLLSIALGHCEKIKDEVLDKIHPELKNHFRNELQKGLKLHLSYQNRETDDIAAEILGVSLMNQWIDWRNAHIKEIRIVSQKKWESNNSAD